MKEEIAALLRKAHRKLDAGRHSLRDGFPEEAASDAYYAMHHAAKARCFHVREGLRNMTT